MEPTGEGLAARRPAVPLAAAAGPENPPCPACGEPLFPWAEAPRVTALRCENCGLGLGKDLGGQLELAAALEGQRRLPHAASLQAWIGTESWARMDGSSRWLPTRDAASRVEPRLAVAPRPDLAGMWQTLVNLFTFGHNIALGSARRATPSPAGKRWQRRVDVAITALAGLPLLLVALALEGVASILGRGGWLKRR